jgi:colanic acid/amylovoran biosynthesis glycosyltransferase
MRIAYLTGRYPTVTHTFILREVQALRGLGTEVKTFSIWRSNQSDLLSPAEREEAPLTDALLRPKFRRFLSSHAIAVARGRGAYLAALRRAFGLSSPGLRRRALALTWFLEAIVLWDACRRRRLRHIHAHLDGTAPMVALLTAEFARALRDRGGTWSWSHTVHGSKEFYDIQREHLDARAASASFIACVSDHTRSQVMAFVPEELWHKLVVVRCGVDPETFARARSPGSRKVPRILTIGRVDAMKGIVLLLDVLAQLRQRGLRPQLTVVGDGPSRAKAMEMAERAGLGQQVTWIGAVGQDEIRDHYADSDVFCLPSFAEGVPIVLMEAMAMELPVVASAIAGIPELVEDHVSGFLVRPGRADDLADRLARLLEDPSLRAEMGRAGRRRVVEDYDVRRNVRALARLFAERAPGAANSSMG